MDALKYNFLVNNGLFSYAKDKNATVHNFFELVSKYHEYPVLEKNVAKRPQEVCDARSCVFYKRKPERHFFSNEQINLFLLAMSKTMGKPANTVNEAVEFLTKNKFIEQQSTFDKKGTPNAFFKRLESDFLHIYGHRAQGLKYSPDEVAVRFYLDLKADNILKFATQFAKASSEKELPYRFKISNNDGENHGVVIYSSYKNAQGFLDIVRSVKQNSPEVFKGTVVSNPMLASIEGYIGFGEEPSIKKDDGFRYSFSSLRGAMLEEVRDILKKEPCLKWESIPNSTLGLDMREFDANQIEQHTLSYDIVNGINKLTERYDFSIAYPYLNRSTTKELKMAQSKMSKANNL